MIGIILLFTWSLLAIIGLISKKDCFRINILIVMCVFQNFILILAAPYINKMVFNAFVFVKELYVILLIVKNLYLNSRLTKFQLNCIISIGFIIISGFIYGIDNYAGMLASVRQMYLPFVFFLLGSTNYKSVTSINKTIYFFVCIMIVTAVFGWIEMALGTSFWITLGYPSFAALKGTESGLSYEGIHGAFYTWDLGIRLRRMASFLAEPVILSQLLSFALIFVIFLDNLFRTKTRRIIAILILGCALLSSLGKGGIIIALFSFALIVGDIWHQRGLAFLAKCSFIVVLIAGIAYVVSNEANGSNLHLTGLTENLINLVYYPFGRGIGSVGNLGYNYGGRTELLARGESFIGAVIGQLGVFAIVLYTYFYSNLIKKISIASKESLYSVGRICLWLNVGLLLTSLANNTAISFTSCFIFYIVAGGVYGTYRVDKEITKSRGNNIWTKLG